MNIERPDNRCLLMGIVNVTPDSFSDGGRFFSASKAVDHALALMEDGADVLDVGGESTRPGAVEVPEDEELRRVLPVIEQLARHAAIPISVDTRKARVADAALSAGASIVNDISALRHDDDMLGVLLRHRATVVLMHMQGEPSTMHIDPRYADVIAEVLEFFTERLAVCASAGINDVWLDPGIGFGKRLNDNLTLLKDLDRLAALGFPLLVGTSRKSFIGYLGGNDTGNRLPGTIASCVLARRNGASMLRVHDVREVRDAIRVADAIMIGEV